MRIAAVSLRVKDAAALAAFYQHKLGMKQLVDSGGCFASDDSSKSVWIGYGEPLQAHLELLEQTPGTSSTSTTRTTTYQASRDDVYWKIGLTLADVERARNRLIHIHRVDTSEPQQFGDIGYLSHLQDPEGFSIELLQHTFESNFVPSPLMEQHPLGSEVTLAHITLRVSDIEQHVHFYSTILGMKLLSIQEVKRYGFTLYFLAFTTDTPPIPDDIRAIGNREWLWQRPYTILELQHVPQHTAPFVLPSHDDGASGFAGLCIRTLSNNMSTICERLERYQVAMEASPTTNNSITILDPQGVRITISPE